MVFPNVYLLVFLIVIGHAYGSVHFENYKKFFNKAVLNELDKYESGNYSFEDGEILRIYKPDQNIDYFDLNGKSESVLVHSIEEQRSCIGVVTEESETIVLSCPDTLPTDPGCFYVFSPSERGENDVPSDERKVAKVCAEVLNERCVGIVTPNNWTLPLHCIEAALLGNS